jgi:hypothetical protein
MNNVNKSPPLPVSQDAPIALEGAPETGSRAAALAAGLGAAFLGAILWETFMVQARLHIAFVAVALGFGVALAVRKGGGGNTASFAMVGAMCTVIGCLLGEVFTAAGFHADAHSLSTILVVAQMMDDPDMAVRLIQDSFRPLSLLFYAIAVFEGYKLSRRPKW